MEKKMKHAPKGPSAAASSSTLPPSVVASLKALLEEGDDTFCTTAASEKDFECVERAYTSPGGSGGGGIHGLYEDSGDLHEELRRKGTGIMSASEMEMLQRSFQSVRERMLARNRLAIPKLNGGGTSQSSVPFYEQPKDEGNPPDSEDDDDDDDDDDDEDEDADIGAYEDSAMTAAHERQRMSKRHHLSDGVSVSSTAAAGGKREEDGDEEDNEGIDAKLFRKLQTKKCLREDHAHAVPPVPGELLAAVQGAKGAASVREYAFPPPSAMQHKMTREVTLSSKYDVLDEWWERHREDKFEVRKLTGALNAAPLGVSVSHALVCPSSGVCLFVLRMDEYHLYYAGLFATFSYEEASEWASKAISSKAATAAAAAAARSRQMSCHKIPADLLNTKGAVPSASHGGGAPAVYVVRDHAQDNFGLEYKLSDAQRETLRAETIGSWWMSDGPADNHGDGGGARGAAASAAVTPERVLLALWKAEGKRGGRGIKRTAAITFSDAFSATASAAPPQMKLINRVFFSCGCVLGGGAFYRKGAEGKQYI